MRSLGVVGVPVYTPPTLLTQSIIKSPIKSLLTHSLMAHGGKVGEPSPSPRIYLSGFVSLHSESNKKEKTGSITEMKYDRTIFCARGSPEFLNLP